MSAKAISTGPHPPVCEPFRAALENSTGNPINSPRTQCSHRDQAELWALASSTPSPTQQAGPTRLLPEAPQQEGSRSHEGPGQASARSCQAGCCGLIPDSQDKLHYLCSGRFLKFPQLRETARRSPVWTSLGDSVRTAEEVLRPRGPEDQQEGRRPDRTDAPSVFPSQHTTLSVKTIWYNLAMPPGCW